MMNRMIVGNLVHRPLRSLISVVAVALEVTLILLIVGLSLGMLQDTRARAAGIGADVLVLPPGSSFIVGLTGAPMPKTPAAAPARQKRRSRDHDNRFGGCARDHCRGRLA